MGVLVAALAACSTGGSTAADPNVTLQQALSDYFAGNITLAKAEFEVVVKNDPNDQYGWYNLGVIEQGAGNTSKAASDYLKAISDPAQLRVGALQPRRVALPGRTRSTTRSPISAGPSMPNPRTRTRSGTTVSRSAETRTPADNAKSKNELNTALKINPTLIKTLGTPKTTAPPSGGTRRRAVSGAKPNGQTATTKPSAP